MELETLAVLFAITKLKKYFLGKQFLIKINNQPRKAIASGVKKKMLEYPDGH